VLDALELEHWRVRRADIHKHAGLRLGNVAEPRCVGMVAPKNFTETLFFGAPGNVHPVKVEPTSQAALIKSQGEAPLMGV
jgi:hypothetical protein